MVKILLLASLFLVSCATKSTSFPNQGTSSSKKENIEELVDLIDFKEALLVSTSEFAYSEILKGIMKTRDVSSQESNEVRKIVHDAVLKIYIQNNEELDVILNDLNQFYDSHYTHPEILELIKFYKTPIGEKSKKLALASYRIGYSVGERFGVIIEKKFIELMQDSRAPSSIVLPKNFKIRKDIGEQRP